MKKLWATSLVTLLVMPIAHAGVWTGRLPITNLYLQSSYDGVFVNQTSTSTDASIMGCNRDMYFLPRTHVFFKEIYAMLLTARATGTPVDLYLDVCVSGVGGTRPIINYVRDSDQ